MTEERKKLIEDLRGFTTSELCDGAGLYHSMDYTIKPWINGERIVGPALTVDVPSGEGAIVADAILQAKEGDVEECKEVGFPVFARGITCGTAGKSGAGAINVTVSCGGVTVRPGDIVVGDRNGVCVIRPEEAKEIMERALRKREKQKTLVEEMKRTGVVVTKVKMAQNLTRKILASHLAKPSEMKPGEEIYLKVDQTLTHDINAVMTYLAFEAVGIDRVRTECSVSHLDHNLLYLDHKTPDDHIYLQSVAKKYGVYVSRPGNGICHAIQVARFGAPGKLSMGGDSHTPHGGAIGMLCIGVGGMDVATAMTGVPMRLKMPEIIRVNLTGRLRPGCNAKEVILEMLRRVTVKGGLGKVFEYVGPGVETLEVSARATIANMGAEMGATTSIFPADEQVRKFMKAQEREGVCPDAAR